MRRPRNSKSNNQRPRRQRDPSIRKSSTRDPSIRKSPTKYSARQELELLDPSLFLYEREKEPPQKSFFEMYKWIILIISVALIVLFIALYFIIKSSISSKIVDSFLQEDNNTTSSMKPIGLEEKTTDPNFGFYNENTFIPIDLSSIVITDILAEVQKRLIITQTKQENIDKSPETEENKESNINIADTENISTKQNLENSSAIEQDNNLENSLNQDTNTIEENISSEKSDYDSLFNEILPVDRQSIKQ